MRGKRRVFVLVVICSLVLTGKAQAFIILNELLADPPTGILGDSNGDSVGSTTQDEFVELLNFGNDEVDVSGWSISDAVKTRHVFSQNSILAPYSYMVVFGGGTPNLPGINWQTASTGSLGLNNSGDTVSLFDIDLFMIDQMTYGSFGGKDQSIVRFPEGNGTGFVLHSSIEANQGALYSPGSGNVEPPDQNANPVVPEIPGIIQCALGAIAMIRMRMIRYK